jgi:hypothetical protein
VLNEYRRNRTSATVWCGRARSGLCGALFSLALILATGSARADEPAPVIRFSAHILNFYQWNQDDSELNKFDLRLYQDIMLGDGWHLRLREDLPIVTTDKIGHDNEDGNWSTHIGDAFLQAVVTTPEIAENTTLEFGLRTVFPTGGLSPFGDGSWQLGPQAGISHRFENVADGLVIAPTARYLFRVHKAYDDADPYKQWQLYPRAELTFAEKWELGFWVENPIVYDNVTDRWFVPLDVMVTHRFEGPISLAAGFATALVDRQPEYKHMVYGRFAIRF